MRYTKIAILFMVLMMLMKQQPAFSQTPADENNIRAIFNKMQQAWAANDYGYTKYDILDPNAILINPIGMYWKNKVEITKGLQYLGEVRFKYFKTIEDSIVSIRFLSRSVVLVIVHATEEVKQDFTMAGETTANKKGERSESWRTNTLIKGNDSWKITSITVTHIVK